MLKGREHQINIKERKVVGNIYDGKYQSHGFKYREGDK